MKITCERLTHEDVWMEACSATIGGKSVGVSWFKMLDAEHSPIRCCWYRIRMEDIPTCVSVHLVRHKIGVEHFVKSNRPDRGGAYNIGRMSPVLHVMDANAQALMTMARRRLCYQAEKHTLAVFQGVLEAVATVDSVLASLMVPMCQYRGGKCHEVKPCKLAKSKACAYGEVPKAE